MNVGQEVLVKLLDGRFAKGEVTYVARVGEKSTHSFRFEAEIPNEDGALNAGTSAEIMVLTGQQEAQFLAPSSLTLNGEGDVGVKVVDTSKTVQFFPVEIIRSERNGFWVSGIPDSSQVITLGQGFVSIGETVVPVLVEADLVSSDALIKESFPDSKQLSASQSEHASSAFHF